VVEIEAASAEDLVPESAGVGGAFEVVAAGDAVGEEVEGEEGRAVQRKAIRNGFR